MSSGDTGKPKLSWAQVAQKKGDTGAAAAQASAPPPAPAPKAVPVPAPKPPAVAVSGGVVSCANIQARGYPLGFKDKAEFDQAMGELKSALEQEGVKFSAIGVRGSSVTVNSNNPKKKGSYFDKRGKGKSDIDVFFVTTDRLKSAPSKKGIFYDKDMAEQYPAISAWNQKWSAKLKPARKVAVAGFRPFAAMKPSAADSIVSSGAL